MYILCDVMLALDCSEATQKDMVKRLVGNHNKTQECANRKDIF